MANIALIVAAGKGRRTKLDIPKQFINVYDKPIVIYTLENFQKHPDIDRIVVSCLDGWQDILWAYAKEYGITLIALIITIIIMLILVAVSVSILINSGLIGKAKEAASKTKTAYESEQELSNGKITIGDRTYNSID